MIDPNLIPSLRLELEATVATVNTLEEQRLRSVRKLDGQHLRRPNGSRLCWRYSRPKLLLNTLLHLAVQCRSRRPSPSSATASPPQPRLADIDQAGADRC